MNLPVDSSIPLSRRNDCTHGLALALADSAGFTVNRTSIRVAHRNSTASNG